MVQPVRYLINTCAIGDLEGISPSTSYTNDAAVRTRVWTGLERLASEGRLATVYAAKEEIKRRCNGDVLTRLTALKGFFLPDSPALIAEVPVFSASPDWERDIQKRKPNRDPADPYLVALAILGGYVVVNDREAQERPNSQQ